MRGCELGEGGFGCPNFLFVFPPHLAVEHAEVVERRDDREGPVEPVEDEHLHLVDEGDGVAVDGGRAPSPFPLVLVTDVLHEPLGSGARLLALLVLACAKKRGGA